MDDVFVRKDLYEGKYAPDLEKQRIFELESNGNQLWNFEEVKQELHKIKPDIENAKV